MTVGADPTQRTQRTQRKGHSWICLCVLGVRCVDAGLEQGGEGRSRIGDQTFEWGPRDLFVVPSWQWVTHESDEDSVLFSFSDRPVQQKLDLFREDRGNA